MADETIEPIYQAIGARMRMIRDTLGVDQAELAKRCKMSRPSICNIEVARQRINLHQIEIIAGALGSNPKGFLKGIWW